MTVENTSGIIGRHLIVAGVLWIHNLPRSTALLHSSTNFDLKKDDHKVSFACGCGPCVAMKEHSLT